MKKRRKIKDELFKVKIRGKKETNKRKKEISLKLLRLLIHIINNECYAIIILLFLLFKKSK